MHRAQGDLDTARLHHDEALALYRAHAPPDALGLANALRSIALLDEDQDDTKHARARWREARDIYLRHGIAEGVSECNEHLEDDG